MNFAKKPSSIPILGMICLPWFSLATSTKANDIRYVKLVKIQCHGSNSL